jgi:hypothetical protein
MFFDRPTMYDYWHIPSIMDCTADFLTFQMLVLIGADSFSFLIATFWKSQGIYSFWKMAAVQ